MMCRSWDYTQCQVSSNEIKLCSITWIWLIRPRLDPLLSLREFCPITVPFKRIRVRMSISQTFWRFEQSSEKKVLETRQPTWSRKALVIHEKPSLRILNLSLQSR